MDLTGAQLQNNLKNRNKATGCSSALGCSTDTYLAEKNWLAFAAACKKEDVEKGSDVLRSQLIATYSLGFDKCQSPKGKPAICKLRIIGTWEKGIVRYPQHRQWHEFGVSAFLELQKFHTAHKFVPGEFFAVAKLMKVGCPKVWDGMRPHMPFFFGE